MIGVAISTHARPDVLARSLAAWAACMPDVLVVTHDVAGEGIAVTKNRGISALMDAGCEHLFLLDDDVWPKVPEPWAPYIASPLPHLLYCRPNHPVKWTDGVHRDASQPNGVMCYVTRDVIDRVGGMRVEFGRYGTEHGEWSRRIHNAGFTPRPFVGLVNETARATWHALDFEEGVESTVDRAAFDRDWPRRNAIRKKHWRSTEFVDYR